MAIYAVGDIQGCYKPLAKLLDKVNFDPSKDHLLCVGDLVNRGPKSAKVLRLLRSLDDQCTCVLGNHDIHFLAVAYGIRKPRATDTLDKLLKAPDLQELCDWTRQQPLLSINKESKYALCHAGIYPWWTRKQAIKYSREVERDFQDEKRCVALLKKVYGNQPSKWKKSLGNVRRKRFIINAFTRMRFCSPKGHLNLTESGFSGKGRKNRLPWFEIDNKDFEDYRVIFGHWSALGLLNTRRHLCLDTGCVWGRQMSMAKIPKKPQKKVKLIITSNG